MREKIIALIACLIIFTVVLVIGVTTVVRSNARPESTPQKPLKQPVAVPAPAENPPAPAVVKTPVKKYRFKRSDRFINRQAFDFATAARLPKALAKYRYTAGILVDLDSRKVLWHQNSQKPVPIASLTKLLTIYTAFEEMEKHEDINLKTRVTVSLECAAADKVKMNLKPGEKIPLNELFIYSMLRSANDAAHLIAEYFGNGESDVFVKKMNDCAQLIGMTGSQFFNANGLPIYGQKPEDTKMNIASCQDMVKLIDNLYDYPKILQYTSLREINTPYGVIRNGNRLLGSIRGMEGLKTGYTNAAGNCLAFSCRQNGRRLAGVVTGFAKRRNCFDFTAKLLDWGFRRK
ncbi:MAG: D-alanyl-D-alanine carboxypeptidase [Lentisphaerae bacterium]|nr:D-alanyl-D-alanine carboxypeptidase [Lentisphaerota bacterium]